MQADYTKQLDEIVRILSKPSTPTWVVSLVSMGFGIVGTLIALLVGDFYKRYKLRRVLYGNLISLFQELSAILEFQSALGSPDKWVVEESRKTLKFDGQQHLKASQDLYIGLSEYDTAEALFDRFHAILDDSSGLDLVLARTAFASAVKTGMLKRRWLRFSCSSVAFESLMRRVDNVWKVYGAPHPPPGSPASD